MLSLEAGVLIKHEHYRDLLREADHERLLSRLPAREPLLDRVLNGVVRWLTSRADLIQTQVQVAAVRCCSSALCC
jgi:hypothetical protein